MAGLGSGFSTLEKKVLSRKHCMIVAMEKANRNRKRTSGLL